MTAAPYGRPQNGASATTPPWRPRTESDGRIEASIATGARVPSEDLMTNGGWFAKIPHALITILCQAHGLSGTHYRYLLTLIQHSQGFQSDFAIRTIRDRRPPTIADWSAWLGDISKKQVYAIRRELRQWHLVYSIDGDNDKVALNLRWETWDQAIFERQRSRRPPRQNVTEATIQEAIPDTDPLFFGDAPVTCNLLSAENEELADDQSVTCKLPGVGDEPSPEAASEGSLNNVIRDTKEVTDAGASDAPRASSAPAHSPDSELSEGHEPRPRRKRHPSQKKATPERAGSRPPNSAPPPLSHAGLPERLNGETTRAYWLRLYHEVAGNVGDEQRLVHRCAHAELGFALTEEGTLPVADCILLGQLQHVAGNWGTVMHWLIECSSRAVAEPRGYLRGIARRQQDKTDQEKPGKPRQGQRPFDLPTTSASPGAGTEDGEAAAHASDPSSSDDEGPSSVAPVDERALVRSQVAMVYGWNYPVGRDVHVLPKQAAAFIDDATTILVGQQEPVATCRRRAERAARMARDYYPHQHGQAHVDHILAALRERW